MADPSSAPLGRQLEESAASAGFRVDEPIIIAVAGRRVGRLVVHRAVAAPDSGLVPNSIVYAASLSKQVTAACVALLVTGGSIDLDSPVLGWIPELPGWAASARIRQLLDHTAALPADADLDAAAAERGEPDRTTSGVLTSLATAGRPAHEPGSRFEYSNAGYVCLAVIVERAAGLPLPQLARERLFDPIGMNRTRFWPGPGPAPPGVVSLTPPRPAPLSLGDGGLWTTPTDLLRWSRCLNRDELGISQLVQTPGRLNDGTPLDYGWGAGVRTRSGRRLYRHGGAWAGLRTMLVRAPSEDLSVVVVATADPTDRIVPLTNALLDVLLDPLRVLSTDPDRATRPETSARTPKLGPTG